MSPVAEGPSFDVRRAVIFGIVAVALGVGLVVLVTRLAGTGAIDVKLGDDQFEDIDADGLAQEIDDNGPVLFADAGTGDRDIIVQHLGEDADVGWYAFNAQVAGRARECTLVWDPDRSLFYDRCDETVTVPADGGNQPSYPISVVDGELVVDLNAAARDEADES